MLRVICPSTFPGRGIYEVSVSQTPIFFGFRSPKFEHVSRFGRHICVSPARQRFFGPKRAISPGVLANRVVQSKNSVKQMNKMKQTTPPALFPSPLNDPKRPYTHTRTQVIRTDVR